jgi:hypothetical protein
MRNDHFQIAYVTNDIDRACDVFAARYGVSAYSRLEGPRADGGHIRVELAWVGGTMYELIMVSGPNAEMFNDRLPSDGSFAIRHHHLGYFIHDDTSWDAVHTEAERLGVALIQGNVNVGFLKSCFVDAPELGHYLEYIYPEAAGIAFFENVSAN